MDPVTAAAWKNEALDTVFEALAASKTLTARFVYKGARILNRLLDDTARQSLDIDVNLTDLFVDQYPDRRNQRDEIQSEISIALTQFFDVQQEIIYSLRNVVVRQKPIHDHPMGWNAFVARISLHDQRRPDILGIPALDIDIAAPEKLGQHATALLAVGEYEVTAYTLERIAGEKLRAFLSSLPTYRTKIHRPGDVVRAKDIYDVARILALRPMDDKIFWTTAGNEFKQACSSRYIDCAGMESFSESFDVTRATYENERTIPNNISFQDAWSALAAVVAYWECEDVIPFQFALPTTAPGG